jgi:hypothetical protein
MISLISYKGKNFVLEEAEFCPELKFFNVFNPFRLMPEYTVEERSQRREENNTRIEAMLSRQWENEKKTQSFAKANYRNLPTRYKSKKAKSPAKKPTFEFPNKIAWDKAHREKCRMRVEAQFPPFVAGDFKNPLECKACFDVVFFALQEGVSEEVCDLFVEQLVSLRSVSEEAADIFFSYFMEDPLRLRDYGLVAFPKDGETIPAIEVWQPWLQELMNHRLFSPRNTGRGELGACAVFRQNVKLLAFDELGDIQVNGCNVEIKSIATRKKHIRLGSEISWADSPLHARLAENNHLKRSSLMKHVSRGNVESEQDWIEKEFESVEKFVELAEADLRKVLARYGRMFVYIEDEHVFEEIKLDAVYFNGVTSEGRWKFTIVPNTLFQNL